MKTFNNKLFAIILILCGIASMKIDNDATAFIVLLCMALPLFFAKNNWIGE